MLEHDSLTPALKITPLAWSDTDNWKRQARTELGDTYDFNGATVTAVINVPASYTTDGSLILQLVLQGTGAVYSWNPVTDLVAGDNTIVWEINPETPANAQGITHFGIQLTTPPSSLTILDPFLVKSIEVNFADGGSASSSSVASSEASSSVASSVSAVLTVDFENDDAGTVYGATGWAATDATPTVVTIASITAGSGLPANGSSTKVLRVTVGNWNSSPVVNVSLPGDKTLANYEVKVDAYFPHNTLGLSEANNGYKDLTLMAGATVTGAVQTDNALYHSHVATQGNVDAWTTFTLPVDATKGASLSGDIQLSVGISRSAGTDADAYYLDNIRLVELP
ncbi:hypothetical protein CJA_0448 [Cellvibrio japonicus Ueda107]|uniref:Uncharacterized protein n=1 Tax=Cellvibrio japonicus (strain Ueda107) TaxID=498211 RepID=B3PIA8_CELJU|nr:hypothetical protein CJA_0448 [Cellvibrio japonicus Ueda107]